MFHCLFMMGHFTFSISLSLKLSLSPIFGLRPKISQKVKSFFPRDTMHKRDMCRRAVSVRLSRSKQTHLRREPGFLCRQNGITFLQLPSVWFLQNLAMIRKSPLNTLKAVFKVESHRWGNCTSALGLQTGGFGPWSLFVKFLRCGNAGYQ